MTKEYYFFFLAFKFVDDEEQSRPAEEDCDMLLKTLEKAGKCTLSLMIMITANMTTTDVEKCLLSHTESHIITLPRRRQKDVA